MTTSPCPTDDQLSWRETVSSSWDQLCLINKTSLQSLLVCPVGPTTDESFKKFIPALCRESVKRGKNPLVIDMIGLKQQPFHSGAGFSDLCFHLLDCPFLSRRLEDYGTSDILRLLKLRKACGTWVLIGEDASVISMQFLEGYLTDLRSTSPLLKQRWHTSFTEAGLSFDAHENELTLSHFVPDPARMRFPERYPLVLKLFIEMFQDLSDFKIVSSEWRDKSDSEDKSLLRHEGIDPHAISEVLTSPSRYMIQQIEKYARPTQAGFTLLSKGLFAMNWQRWADLFSGVLDELLRVFDVVIVLTQDPRLQKSNAPLVRSPENRLLFMPLTSVTRGDLRDLLRFGRKNGFGFDGVVAAK